MTTIEQLPATLNLDREGFLLEPKTWNEEVARILARRETKPELTDDHWKLINYLRKFYLEYNTVPPLRMIRRFTGFNMERICELFPSGLTKGACRIAGIPRDTIKPYFFYP